MGRKGARNHLKRLASPLTYPIERHAIGHFIMRPSGSGHRLAESIPLGVIIRDILELARNSHELRYIVNNNNCEVDGRVIRDFRRNIGPMDVLKFNKIDKYYRVIPTTARKRLQLVPISETKNIKLCKITGKTTIRGGVTQFHLHDGRNVLFSEKSEQKQFQAAKPGGTFKVEIPSQKVLDYYPFEENAWVLIDKGVNRARVGRLVGVDKHIGTNRSIAVIAVGDEPIRTALENIFIIGKDNPELPELTTEAKQ